MINKYSLPEIKTPQSLKILLIMPEMYLDQIDKLMKQQL